jgi:flagellar basal-body rod modification protein FlgD
MSTSAIQVGDPASLQAAATSARRTMGKEDFLRLLVTQLSNQDPMNPMSGSEFAAQLAQFASVEQLLNISSGVEAQAGMQHLVAQSINSGVASGLIGKHVEAESASFTLREPGEVRVRFDLPERAAATTVEIRDAAGHVILTRELDALGNGTHEFTWDGRNGTGATVPPGTYSIAIKAESSSGDALNTAPRLFGNVDRVTFGPEGILLWLGSTAVSLGAVKAVVNEP